MEGGVECGRASDAQNPTRKIQRGVKAYIRRENPTRSRWSVRIQRENPTRSFVGMHHDPTLPMGATSHFSAVYKVLPKAPGLGNPTRRSNAVRHGLCYSGWARHVQLLP